MIYVILVILGSSKKGISISVKIKLLGDIWDKKTIIFTKNENKHAIKHFESWGLL